MVHPFTHPNMSGLTPSPINTYTSGLHQSLLSSKLGTSNGTAPWHLTLVPIIQTVKVKFLDH